MAPEPKTTTRIAIDLVFGVAAIGIEILLSIWFLFFVLLTPLIVVKIAMAAIWLGGLVVLLWVWLTRGWPAILVVAVVIGLLIVVGSVAQSVAPVQWGV